MAVKPAINRASSASGHFLMIFFSFSNASSASFSLIRKRTSARFTSRLLRFFRLLLANHFKVASVSPIAMSRLAFKRMKPVTLGRFLRALLIVFNACSRSPFFASRLAIKANKEGLLRSLLLLSVLSRFN